jgi:hypothetical protein
VKRWLGGSPLKARVTNRMQFKRPVRGKASGVETEFDYWWVGTFRSGRILRNWWFADRTNALEAAGLSE